MTLLDIVLLAVSLSMDAFAVSLCKGLAMEKLKARHCITVGAWFGAFQALMPLLGYLLGSTFADRITSIDHWIAFVLLVLIGGNMIREAFGEDGEEHEEEMDAPLRIKEMFLLAIATSIDALAVGVTFAFLKYPIVESIIIIGCTTFVLSIIGVYVGNVFGNKYEKKAQIAGGIILIGIGIKILLEHLGVIAF